MKKEKFCKIRTGHFPTTSIILISFKVKKCGSYNHKCQQLEEKKSQKEDMTQCISTSCSSQHHSSLM